MRGARPPSGRHRHPLTPPVSLLSRIEILRADVAVCWKCDNDRPRAPAGEWLRRSVQPHVVRFSLRRRRESGASARLDVAVRTRVAQATQTSGRKGVTACRCLARRRSAGRFWCLPADDRSDAAALAAVAPLLFVFAFAGVDLGGGELASTGLVESSESPRAARHGPAAVTRAASAGSVEYANKPDLQAEPNSRTPHADRSGGEHHQRVGTQTKFCLQIARFAARRRARDRVWGAPQPFVRATCQYGLRSPPAPSGSPRRRTRCRPRSAPPSSVRASSSPRRGRRPGARAASRGTRP